MSFLAYLGRVFIAVATAGVFTCFANAGVVPRHDLAPALGTAQSPYYWRATSVNSPTSVDNSAQLVTLFLRTEAGGRADVPVISVLRDTLGDADTDNDRLISLWLLSDSPLTTSKRLLAAVPFLYWRIGQGSSQHVVSHVKPFVDLTQSQTPMFYAASREILQWTMLDPMTLPVRASSRAYRTNEVEQERLQLEEAIGYLHHAPTGMSESALSQEEVDSIIARLELRKQLLGGLIRNRALTRLGEQARFNEERVRSRNWEMLRQIAERTGLFFEPLQITGTRDEYAMLWFSPEMSEPAGVSHKALWKLLNVRDPWTDHRLQDWKGPVSIRNTTADGDLLPEGETGERSVHLIPLGAYSMDYPRMPLLMIDFRDNIHVRRHEMTQRAITEVTSGVIGISHFTNWYYYVAADAYDFIASRRGGAVDQSERLDSYSRFRVALALDSDVDAGLRSEMQHRLNAMAVNPLDSSPERELKLSQARYDALENESQNGQLAHLLDKHRRAELASYGKTNAQIAAKALLHIASFGMFTSRVPAGASTVQKLSDARLLEANLTFLENVNIAGTAPEIAYDRQRLRESLQVVSSLSVDRVSALTSERVQHAIQRFQSLTGDPVLIEDCRLALDHVHVGVPGMTASIHARSLAVHSEPAQ